MTSQPQAPIVKSHGDKLSHAAGQTPAPQDILPIAGAEPPLKREGDKLGAAFGKAIRPS